MRAQGGLFVNGQSAGVCAGGRAVYAMLTRGTNTERKRVVVFGTEVIDGDGTGAAIEIVAEVPLFGEGGVHIEDDVAIVLDREFTDPDPIVILRGVIGRFAEAETDEVVVNGGLIESAGERRLILAILQGQGFAAAEESDEREESEEREF